VAVEIFLLSGALENMQAFEVEVDADSNHAPLPASVAAMKVTHLASVG
jgi:hypothetical protein